MNFWQFRCIECEKPLQIAHWGICSHCNQQLPRSAYCGCCGTLLPENQLYCGQCLQNEPKWHRLVQISCYKPPLAHWIHRFKFQHQYWLDQPLARLLLLAIKQAQREHQLTLPDVILPVPLFWQRHWQRGFNQAELIARHLSHWLNLPLDTQSLQRLKSTRPQRELTARERRINLKGAFYYQPLKGYQRVAIVDDVLTTGSTLNMICTELQKKKVNEIQVWTLAKV